MRGLPGLRHLTTSTTSCEIRLSSCNNGVIVLHGRPGDTVHNQTHVSGALLLSLADSISVKAITLRFEGRFELRRPVVDVAGLDRNAYHRLKSVIFSKDWSFLPNVQSGHGLTLGIGEYEYPFEFSLPLDLPESLEGNETGSVTYRLRATVERDTFAKDMVVKKHLRLVRTRAMELEYTDSQTVENVWLGKCDYKIFVPLSICPLGSSVPFNIKVVPLLKGLSCAMITCEVKQRDQVNIAGESPDGTVIQRNFEKCVARIQIDPSRSADDTISGDIWEISGDIKLPQSLLYCSQDCDFADILRIKHHIKFVIALRNPDGHISELRARVPVVITLPQGLDEYGTVTALATEVGHEEDDFAIPPSYQSSLFDRTWDGVSGVDTPSTSMANTPLTHSRRGSEVNLNQLGGLAPLTTPDDRDNLTERLVLLQMQEQSDNSTSGVQYPSIVLSDTQLLPESPNRLSPDALVTALSRVPSYDSAIRDTAASTSSYSAPAPRYLRNEDAGC